MYIDAIQDTKREETQQSSAASSPAAAGAWAAGCRNLYKGLFANPDAELRQDGLQMRTGRTSRTLHLSLRAGGRTEQPAVRADRSCRGGPAAGADDRRDRGGDTGDLRHQPRAFSQRQVGLDDRSGPHSRAGGGGSKHVEFGDLLRRAYR